MNRPTLCLSDTPYQLGVQKSAELPGAIYLHWNARRVDVAEAPDLRVFASARAFLTAALKALPGAERVVIGDFRSTTQLLAIFAAMALGREFVISDDGLINHICDRWGYTRENLTNGGLKGWKLPLIERIRRRLETAPRLSTFPNFTQRFSKAAYTLGARPRVRRTPTAVRRVVFIGQPCEILGIAPASIRTVLDALAAEWGRRAELIYAPHPREADPQALAGEAWRIRPRGGPVEADPELADGATLWAGITSTALLEVGATGDRVRMTDVAGLDYLIAGRRRRHLRTQQVMCDIAVAEDMAQFELWAPGERGQGVKAV